MARHPGYLRRMWGEKPETKAELLDYLARTYGEPLRFVALAAAQISIDNPELLPPEVLEELQVDRDGWALQVEREHRLEPPVAVRVLVRPGADHAEVLAMLDRIRAELVARPQLLDKDWSKPLPRRPVLKVVKPPEEP